MKTDFYNDLPESHKAALEHIKKDIQKAIDAGDQKTVLLRVVATLHLLELDCVGNIIYAALVAHELGISSEEAFILMDAHQGFTDDSSE